MHFLDPERPLVASLPAFAPDVPAFGKSIIPGLYVVPRGTPESNVLEISGFFSAGKNASTRKVIEIPLAEFPAFWQRWLVDPEGVAEKEFGLQPPKAAPPAKAFSDLDSLIADLF